MSTQRSSFFGTRYAVGLLLAVMVSARAFAADTPSIAGRVTGADGKGIGGAIVFVQSPGADGSFGGTNPMATMDQVEKTFVPGLLPIVVGTRVRFPNHDQIHHHVYSFSRTKQFELPLYKGEDAAPVLFDKVGVVKVGCNIHDWMSGIILVLPSPYFVQTDAEGGYALEGLPHGKYSVVAWHELSKTKPEDTAQAVTVGASPAEANFTLTLGAARVRPAVRGSRREP